MNDDRRAILARRARLVAAAVTAAGLAGAHGCAREARPEPCLEPLHVEDEVVDEVVVPEVDAAAVEPDDEDAALPERSDAGAQIEEPPVDETPPPRVCLSL